MNATVKKLGALSLVFCFTLVFTANVSGQQLPPTGQISPAQALAKYEQALQAATDPTRRFYLTTKTAPTALAAGETEKAKTYARDLLEQAAGMRTNWNYGNAIHVANLVLGRIALASGNVTEAKRLLLDAGKSPGSPQLNSFGPNMLLAKELLAKGEREAVIEYFDLCAIFWKPQDGRLSAWKALVIKGDTPDFGANLAYRLDDWRFENWAKLGI